MGGGAGGGGGGGGGVVVLAAAVLVHRQNVENTHYSLSSTLAGVILKSIPRKARWVTTSLLKECQVDQDTDRRWHNVTLLT